MSFVLWTSFLDSIVRNMCLCTRYSSSKWLFSTDNHYNNRIPIKHGLWRVIRLCVIELKESLVKNFTLIDVKYTPLTWTVYWCQSVIPWVLDSGVVSESSKTSRLLESMRKWPLIVPEYLCTSSGLMKVKNSENIIKQSYGIILSKGF